MGDRIEFVDRRHQRELRVVLGASVAAGVLAYLTNMVVVGALVLGSAIVGVLVWFGLR